MSAQVEEIIVDSNLNKAQYLAPNFAQLALDPSPWFYEWSVNVWSTEGIDVAALYPTRGLRALVVDDMEPEFARSRVVDRLFFPPTIRTAIRSTHKPSPTS